MKYRFIGWSGDLVGSENPVTVQMNADATIVANYSLVTHKLNFSSLPVAVQVSVQVGNNAPVPLNSGSSIDVPEGETVTIVAPAEVSG